MVFGLGLLNSEFCLDVCLCVIWLVVLIIFGSCSISEVWLWLSLLSVLQLIIVFSVCWLSLVELMWVQKFSRFLNGLFFSCFLIIVLQVFWLIFLIVFRLYWIVFGVIVLNMKVDWFIFGGSMVRLRLCILLRKLIILLVLFRFEDSVVVMNLVG